MMILALYLMGLTLLASRFILVDAVTRSHKPRTFAVLMDSFAFLGGTFLGAATALAVSGFECLAWQ